MHFQYQLARVAACLLLATAGVHAHAQLPLQAAAADPQASVPATRYQSAIDVRPPAAAAASPDRNWVAGNEKVAATNSMALTMKPMGGHAGHAMPAAQSADPHAGEEMQCKAGGCCAEEAAMDGKGGQGKMPCCQSCPCMDKMKKNKETP
jgi:hypothetical protein